jgi:hypothetical protein
MKMVLIQILKKPQKINEEYQQDADCRNRIMEENNVIQGQQHKGPLDKPSIDNLRDVNVVQGQHRPPLEKPSGKVFPGDPKATTNIKVKRYSAPWTYQQDHQRALQKMKQALYGIDQSEPPPEPQ